MSDTFPNPDCHSGVISEEAREWWTPLPLAEIQEALGGIAQPSLCALGCGEREVPAYVKKFPTLARVVGVDIDPLALVRLEQEMQGLGWNGSFQTLTADVTRYGALGILGGEEFDVATSVGLGTNTQVVALELVGNALTDFFTVMRNVHDVLKLGGSYIISDFLFQNSPWWRRRYNQAMDVWEIVRPDIAGLMYGCFITRPFGRDAIDVVENMSPNEIARAFELGMIGRVVRHWGRNVFTKVLPVVGFDVVSIKEEEIVEHVSGGSVHEADRLRNIRIRAVKRNVWERRRGI